MATAVSQDDRTHLARALEVAERGRGSVSPNPMVGCVIARDGEVIGEGWHAELGGLHAERAALADCAERGNDAGGRHRLRHARALRARRPPASLRRRARRGSRRPRRLPLRRSLREGERPRARHPSRRRHRGRARPGRRSRRGPPSHPAVPKARADRAPAGDAQVGAHPRRAHRHRARRLEVDLGTGEPSARPLAGAPRPTPSRSGSAPRSPTTPCSPRATSIRPPRRQPLRVVFDSAARLPVGLGDGRERIARRPSFVIAVTRRARRSAPIPSATPAWTSSSSTAIPSPA